jgi:hypothetical protein
MKLTLVYECHRFTFWLLKPFLQWSNPDATIVHYKEYNRNVKELL